MHPGFGTLEFRVPDAQSTIADVAAIAAVTQGLIAWLGDRHDRGERLPVAETWQIEENRWSACRHGLEGEMAELHTRVRRRPTRQLLRERIQRLEHAEGGLDIDRELRHAYLMIETNGAIAQRAAARHGGTVAVAQSLTTRFLEEPSWFASGNGPTGPSRS
jgi:carboxylate-amine ligase